MTAATCAFVPCAEATTCPLVGGCIVRRFPQQQRRRQHVDEPKGKALNGTKPKRGETKDERK